MAPDEAWANQGARDAHLSLGGNSNQRSECGPEGELLLHCTCPAHAWVLP